MTLPSAGTLSVGEQSAAANGAPSFLGLSLLDDLKATPFMGSLSAAIEWRTGALLDSSGSDSTTDLTDSSFPANRIHDRHGHTYSKAADGTLSTFITTYLFINFTAGTDDAHTLDTIYLQFLNIPEIIAAHVDNGSITVTVVGTDTADTDFSSAVTLATFSTLTDSNELIAVNLNSWAFYDDVDMIRIQITINGAASRNFVGEEPQIAIVHTGKKRQVAHFPIEKGLDETSWRSEEVKTKFNTGVISKHVLSFGGEFFDLKWEITESAGTFLGVDDIAAMRDWFKDIDYGTKNFLYIDESDLTPIRGHYCNLDRARLKLPRDGPNARTGRTVFTEIPVFQSRRDT